MIRKNMFTQFHLRPGSISFVIFLTIKIISSSFLVSVILDSVLAKVYSDCELVKEIHFEHLVPRDDIYKHLCASGRDTSRTDGSLGIYGHGRHACGENEPSGHCNVHCHKLNDKDIEHDVNCAQLLLADHGVHIWSRGGKALVNADCKFEFDREVHRCLDFSH